MTVSSGLEQSPPEEQTCGKVQRPTVAENAGLGHLHGIPVLVEIHIDSRSLWHVAQKAGVGLQALDIQGQQGDADSNQ